MSRIYTIDGQKMTAEEVARIENPTESQKQQFIKQSGLSDARLSDITMMAEVFAPIVREYVVRNVQPIVDRLVAAEGRISQIEAGGIKFCGVHQRALEYKKGAVVVADGSSWISLDDENRDVPGTSGRWVLMAKRGRDAKDAATR